MLRQKNFSNKNNLTNPFVVFSSYFILLSPKMLTIYRHRTLQIVVSPITLKKVGDAVYAAGKHRQQYVRPYCAAPHLARFTFIIE